VKYGYIPVYPAILSQLGVLEEDKQQLDYVLSLTPQNLLDRRLQTQVHKTVAATTVHHARTLIFHRHITVENQLINQAWFLVWKDNGSHIQI
jgi:small subunit ribosomal protein S9e